MFIASSTLDKSFVCAFAVKPTNDSSNTTIVAMGFTLSFLFKLIFELKMIYNKGSTNRVRNVAVTKPPITTVANGFCTSAPALLLKAIGRNPKLATVAVIKTGRKRILVPSITRFNTSFSPSFSN